MASRPRRQVAATEGSERPLTAARPEAGR
jgi:hypothetical protein